MDNRKVVVKAKKVIATRIRCIVNGRSIMVSVLRDISSLEEAEKSVKTIIWPGCQKLKCV